MAATASKNSFLRMARTQGKVERLDSAIEAQFAQQLRIEHAPPWERNVVFLPDRRLEIDFGWKDIKFAVEVQGAVHRVEDMFHRDAEKMALALLAGWTICRSPVARSATAAPSNGRWSCCEGG
jgi:hypothetical protein